MVILDKVSGVVVALCVLMACSGDDAGTATTTTTTDVSGATGNSNTTTNDTTTGSTDTSVSGTLSSTGATSDGPTTADATSTGGETATTAEETSSTGTTGEALGPCESYAAISTECLGGSTYRMVLSMCEDELDGLLEDYGEGCAVAFEAHALCEGGLSCGQFIDDLGCEAEAEAVAATCAYEVGPECQAYSEKWFECFGNLEEVAAQNCQEGLNDMYEMSEVCGLVAAEHVKCRNGLNCVDFDNNAGCDAELMNWVDTCFG